MASTGNDARAPVFRCSPGRDTWWAIASVPLLWACYWDSTRLMDEHPAVSVAVFFVLGNLLVCTALPALVVTRIAREGWSGLGFTRRRLWLALTLMVVLGIGSLPYYLQLAAVVFPIAGGVASGIGTIQSGLVLDWADFAIGAGILLVQTVLLALIVRARPGRAR